MKTVAIHLRPETASHRKRLLGIFKYIGSSGKWDMRLVRDEAHLRALLLAENGTDVPDGIISGVPYNNATKEAIARSGVPFVGIGAFDAESDLPSRRIGLVMNDNVGIGHAAAEYLHSLGDFRSYAYIPDTHGRAWSALRGDAFRATLKRLGAECQTFTSQDDGLEALSAFLAQLPKPTAVFAAWDGRAADTIHAAHNARISIPADMSVLGVDDDDLICEHTFPQLSSIRTDAEGMGEAAAQMLDGIMRKRPCDRRPPIVCRPITGIAKRESTCPPPPASTLIRRALAFINEHAAEGIGTDDVARHLKISRRLLDLRFSQYESRSVSKHISKRKIESAQRLLAESSISVQNAFRQSGFGNIAYATFLFKSITGKSPQAWRKEHKIQSSVREPASAFSRLETLSEADAKSLAALARQLSPDAHTDIHALQKAIRQGTTLVFVLRRRLRIVASATAVRYSTPTGGHCRIEDVVVDERLRGKGLGRAVMDGTLAALRAMNVRHVELTSRPSRIAARALYRSLGFTPRTTNVLALDLQWTNAVAPRKSRMV